jgi:hypothetical protein
VKREHGSRGARLWLHTGGATLPDLQALPQLERPKL